MTALEYFSNEIDLHIKRVEAILPEMQSYIPLGKESFENIEVVKTIDSFIYRFSKIQDKMGEKLFPAVLKELQEYKDSMPLKEVLLKLEKLELIPSADKWIYYRELRNIAAHEYPDNEADVIEAINNMLSAYKEIISIYSHILSKPGILQKNSSG